MVGSHILNYPNDDVGEKEITTYIHELLKENDKANELPDWELEFVLLLGRLWDHVAIWKKGGTFPSDKLKHYTIFIPIPTTEQIFWGVDEKSYIDIKKDDGDDDRVIQLYIPDYHHFSSVSDYIINSAKKGIYARLKRGITLKGVQIKI